MNNKETILNQIETYIEILNSLIPWKAGEYSKNGKFKVKIDISNLLVRGEVIYKNNLGIKYNVITYNYKIDFEEVKLEEYIIVNALIQFYQELIGLSILGKSHTLESGEVSLNILSIRDLIENGI